MTTPLEGLSWGGRRDSKLVLDAAALKKVRRSSLSPSTADSMSGCSASWVISRLLPRRADPFGAAELGTAAHRVFETVFSLSPELRTTKQALRTVSHLQDDEDDNVIAPENPDDLDRWHSAVTQLVTGLWSVENPRELEVVGLEVEVKNVKVAGVPFFGYIDRLVKRDGVLTIGDYKTGKVPNARYGDKHGDQIRAYVLALDNHPTLDTPSAGELLYTQHKQVVRVDLSSTAMAETSEKFARAWTTLTKQTDSGEFSTKPGALCGWCPAVSVCPAAQAKGLVERVAFEVSGEALGIRSSNVSVPVAMPTSRATVDETDDDVDPVFHEPAVRSTSQPATKNSNERNTMYEPKPWEETTDDGELNLSAYAAIAVFGIVEIAVDGLFASGEKITQKSVRAFSQTAQYILREASIDVCGGRPASLQSGAHTRFRGALRTTLTTMPAPFGGTSEEWDEWVRKSIVRTRAIAITAKALWSDDLPERPWADLAVDEPVDVFED